MMTDFYKKKTTRTTLLLAWILWADTVIANDGMETHL
jgi:hypothetical protein